MKVMNQFGKNNKRMPGLRPRLTPFAKNTLAVVESIVKRGFVFFSCVAQGSNSIKPYRRLHEGEFVYMESLFFHLPDAACLVRIEVMESKQLECTDIETTLKVTVWLNHFMSMSLPELRKRYQLAKERGMTTMMPDDTPMGEYEATTVPWLDRVPHIHDWRNGVGGWSNGVRYLSLHRTIKRREYMVEDLQPVFTSLFSVKDFMDTNPVLSTMDNLELHCDEFTAPDSGGREDFDGKFNYRYLKEIVQHIKRY